MKRSVLGAIGIAAALAAVAGCVGGARVQRTGNQAESSSGFEATFATADDFYGRFDYGYSGLNPLATAPGVVTQFHGDHNMNCEGPTTIRDVAFRGTTASLDFSHLFWHCAPGGDPAKGHLMTAVDKIGYSIAWFSPKPTFTAVSKVCWDINETELSSRKWTQVMFVGAADAVRYPAGTVTYPGFPDGGHARGTGGFDLGFTSPDFRDFDGPTTRIHPQGGTLAGVKLGQNSPSWFQNQDTFTTRFEGPGNMLQGITDKAARYQHCLENQPNNVVRLTQATPNGTRVFDMAGQIPQHPVRVVFQDDNYDPPKAENYSPDMVTWHWDNIHIEAGTAVELAAPATQPARGAALTSTADSSPPAEAVLASLATSNEEAADGGGVGSAGLNAAGLLLVAAGLGLAFAVGMRFGRRRVP